MSDLPVGSERRRYPRIPVEMWVQESRDRELYFERAANLSEGGVFLENTIPHPMGTLVQLEFTLPGDSAPIRARGKIVSSMGGGSDLGMGVQFVDLDPEIARRIRAFIEKGITDRRGSP